MCPPFSALMTTLAATIGTGNIVGVATALVGAAPAPWCGWRSPPSSAFPPSARSACWPSSTASGTPAAKCAAAPCIPCAPPCGGSGWEVPWPFSSPSSQSLWPPWAWGTWPRQFHRRGAGRQLLRSGPDHRGGSGSAGSRGHSRRYPADCRSLLRGGALMAVLYLLAGTAAGSICPLCPEPWQRCSAWPSLPPPLRVARRGL